MSKKRNYIYIWVCGAYGRVMYNLMVSAEENAWEGETYEWDIGRVFEYTEESLRKKFRALSGTDLVSLMNLPTLFMYEKGVNKPALVGYVNKIKQTEKSIVVISFEIMREYKPIPSREISRLSRSLDIQSLEFTRTHWSLKDRELIEILTDTGVLERSISDTGLPIRSRLL